MCDHLRDATKKVDFISREAAKTLLHDRAIEMALNNVGFKADASDILEHISKRSMDWIDEVPAADVVEVVRCKNCYAYQRETELAKVACLDPEYYCALLQCEFWPDGFCSYGRRLTDGKNERD